MTNKGNFIKQYGPFQFFELMRPDGKEVPDYFTVHLKENPPLGCSSGIGVIKRSESDRTSLIAMVENDLEMQKRRLDHATKELEKDIATGRAENELNQTRTGIDILKKKYEYVLRAYRVLIGENTDS